MIELKVNWKDIHIMSIFCHDNLFFNNVIPENLIKARQQGFVLSTISNVPILSLNLPNFIKNRIPTNIDDIAYIKSTKCMLETDFITIDTAEDVDIT